MVRIKAVLSALAVAVALIGYLPLQPYLDPFARWFFLAAFVYGLYAEAKGRHLSGRILTPVSIALFLYFASLFNRDTMLVVTADLLVVFLGIRMLGEKNGRNYLQIFGLSLFCLAASSLYNLSALFLVYLLLLLLLLAVSLVVLAFHSHDPKLSFKAGEARKVLAVSCLMPLASLPIMLFLFVFLPRTQRPLWDLTNRSALSRAGFSDTVRPGKVSNVSEEKVVAFRAVCPKLPVSRLYWRGIVMNGFSDNAWVRLPVPRERSLGPERGESIHQEIYPEPSRNLYLPVLNIPRAVAGVPMTQDTDGVFKVRQPLDKRIRYQAQSTISKGIRVRGGIDREFYLRPPAAVSSRMRAEAAEISRPGLTDVDKLKLLERFFRNQRLNYATTDLPTGKDPLDLFLFVRKRGNCEFFASSCATLLRLAGVPARLVGGYRGGDYNELGGYYLVTEDLAHVWVEAYIEGRGWLTVDPTTWAIGFSQRDAFTRTVRMYLDAAGFYWDRAVITYDLDKQLALIRRAGNKAQEMHLPPFSMKRLLAWAPWLLSLVALSALLARRPESREEKVLKGFLKAVARRYPAAAAGKSGLYEMAARIDDPRLREFASIYGSAVYGDRPLNEVELSKLKEIVRSLSQHRS